MNLPVHPVFGPARNNFGRIQDRTPHSKLPMERRFARRVMVGMLPRSIDWWKTLTPHQPVKNQGNQGSCVGHGTGRSYEFLQDICGVKPWFNPSTAFAYWGARFGGGGDAAVKTDSGAQIMDSALSCVVNGMTSNEIFPYRDSVWSVEPDGGVLADAEKYVVLDYQSVNAQDESAVVEALSIAPFPIGISVFEKFMDYTGGILPVPDQDNEKYLGGHCMALTGAEWGQFWWVDNSYGPGFGIQGRMKLAWNYFADANMASDFWLLSRIWV